MVVVVVVAVDVCVVYTLRDAYGKKKRKERSAQLPGGGGSD